MGSEVLRGAVCLVEDADAHQPGVVCARYTCHNNHGAMAATSRHMLAATRLRLGAAATRCQGGVDNRQLQSQGGGGWRRV
jgi:hypothetical protein